tara:strand:+ start:1463 stop:1702 length:240 start_codon:yes stop_codon:yes gene_type:complete
MNKQIIPKEDGLLKHLCNEAHFFIADTFLAFPVSPKKHKILATIEGLASGFLVAYAGESAVNLANNYGANINLEALAYN